MICAICDNKFESKYPHSKYCSIKCRKIAREQIAGYHMDHMIPRCKGGSDDIENLALACIWCNMAKGCSDVDKFIQWIDYIRSGEFKCYMRSDEVKAGID